MRAVDRERLLRERQIAAEGSRNVLPFRRRAKVRRRRRNPLLKLLAPFSAALAIVALPTLLAFWLLTSPRFALREVRVTAEERVPVAWVRRTLSPYEGQNLLSLPLERLRATLEKYPWVRQVDLRKELPGVLHVRLMERQAVALLRQGGELHYVDPDGETIVAYEPTRGPVDLLVISRGSASDTHPKRALDLVKEIENLRPRWATSLSEIEILGAADFRIYMTALPFPLLVRSGSLQSKARQLEALLPQIVHRYGTLAAIDLRFSRRIILQPSASGRQT
jgi:cell division protein FtsQ